MYKKCVLILKTQCYFELARVVNDWICFFDVGSDIKSKLEEELDIVVQVDIDKDSKIRIISKEEIKDKLWRSPDYADACMMRCYFSLIYDYEAPEEEIKNEPKKLYENWKTFEEIMMMDQFEIDDENVFERIR